MRCGVLGVITVTRADGCPVQVTSEKQRALLGILLSRAGQPLSADRLVELMWPGKPPASARPNVQVYVHRLRRLLGGEAIAHGEAGYRLAVDLTDIDAFQFGELARAGEDVLAAGDHEAARAAFDEASALWRGSPYSGLENVEAIQVEVNRLTELRLGVVGGRYEALIRLGRSSQVISDLHASIAEHPWHERYRAQLMRALFAVGRGPDALAVYRESRDLIIEELGIEPGPELRRIERAILTDDTDALGITPGPSVIGAPDGTGSTTSRQAATSHADPGSSAEMTSPAGSDLSESTESTGRPGPLESTTSTESPEAVAREAPLDAARSGPTGPPSSRSWTAPAELPAPDPAFSGRAHLVEEVAGLLTGGAGRIVVLDGRGGAGKSTLALRVAQQLADRYPDGQLYVGLHGATPGREPLPVHVAIARCLRSLGFSDRDIADDVDEAAGQLRSALAGRRVLLVLDDARDAAQVRQLLPGTAARSAVIVTTRGAMPTIGTDHLTVGVLDNADAIELLARVVGSDRVAAEPDAAVGIVELCGHLPLAVRVAAARLVARTDWSLSTMAARLADERHRLDELATDDLTVRSSCAISFDALGPDAAQLFQYLGVLDLTTVSPHVAAALLGRSVVEAERLLDELVDVHLVDTSPGARRVLHDLVRLYARDLAEAQLTVQERRDAIVRVGHHYVLAARAATVATGFVTRRRMEAGVGQNELSGMAPVFEDAGAIRQWVRHEAANLSAVTWHLASVGSTGYRLLLALGSALVAPFGSLGLWSDVAALNEVALAAARQAADPVGVATAHDNLGHIDAHLSRMPTSEEHYGAALIHASGAQDRIGELSALIGLGMAAVRSSRSADARRHLSSALELARVLDDQWSEALVCNGLGMVLTAEGTYDDAVTMYERALDIHDAADEKRWRSVVLFNLGRVHRAAGRSVDAISAFERSVELSRRRGHAVQLARSLWVLADALRDVSFDSEADARRQEALAVLRDLDLVSEPEIADIVATPRPEPPRVLTVT